MEGLLFFASLSSWVIIISVFFGLCWILHSIKSFTVRSFLYDKCSKCGTYITDAYCPCEEYKQNL